MSEEVTSCEMRCYMRHVRAAGLCSGGSRSWCSIHGIDWTDFLLNGITAQRLLETQDPIVLRVVEAARREQANG